MSSIDEMARQIRVQPRVIAGLTRTLHDIIDDKFLRPEDLVFTGCGDSYAAAKIAESLSSHKSMAIDPTELILHPEVALGKTLVFISVSGHTIVNIEAAEATKQIAKARYAVTANIQSELAKTCDRSISIKYDRFNIRTSGTASFTATLVAVFVLLNKLSRGVHNIEEAIAKGESWALENLGNSKQKYLFLGSSSGFGLAMYGAFKIHEVLGWHADYDSSEQFGHSRMFSIDVHNDSIILIGFDRRTIELFNVLTENGFNAHVICPQMNHNNVDSFLNILQVTFSLQYLALKMAQKQGFKECAFLTNNKLLDLSNSLIY